MTLSASPVPLILARQAMATRFEMVLHGSNLARLRAAAEEAFDEITRVEAMLSVYRPESEVARVNALADREAVRVSPTVFHLLEHCARLWRDTGGAFDITMLPLLRCWGLAGGRGRIPSEHELEVTRSLVGMEKVELDANRCTVRFSRPGMRLDLGAIGKGYAVDQAAALLKETGVEHALIHGGTSSVYGLGHPPEYKAWRVALEIPTALLSKELLPPMSSEIAGELPVAVSSDRPKRLPVAVVELNGLSLSVSACWGKSFEREGRTYGHILDPGTGAPAANAIMAAVVTPSAAEGDALSTALLVRGAGARTDINRLRPETSSFVATVTASGILLEGLGISSLHGPGLPRTQGTAGDALVTRRLSP